MARKTKQGLDYFPFDVNFFEDDKLQFVSARFSCKGENITIKLLCKIYSDKGYYYQWGEDESLLFAKRAGFDVALVNDVVNELVKRDFFNKGIFDSFKILTSKGIQERYFEAAKRKKVDALITEILINETIKPLNVTNKVLNVAESTQSKVKEIKVNETIVNEEEKDLALFEDLKIEFLNSHSWMDDIRRIYKVDSIFLLEKINEFLSDLWLKKDFFKGLQECREHFINWLKLELRKVALKNYNNGKQNDGDARLSAIQKW